MKSFPILRVLGALAAAAGGIPYAFADDINQASAQGQATDQNQNGAKGTMDEAVNRATIALMDLGELNVPGALTNGYKAYGHYLNHNQLKDLESATSSNSGTMNSMAGGMLSGATAGSATSGDSSSAITGSTAGNEFREVGHASLYEGTEAAALSRFEAKTGLTRQTLMQNIGQLVDEISRTDLPLEEQGMLIEQHYDRFAASMPNKEFGGHLATVKGMLPLPLRLSFLSHLLGQRDESKMLARPALKPSAMASLAAAVVPASATDALHPESTPPVAAASDDTPVRSAAANQASVLGVQSDSSLSFTDDDATLFTRVNVRYRSLTPMMEQPAAVAAR